MPTKKVEVENEEIKNTSKAPAKKRTIKQEDMIPCKSYCNGQLLIAGDKSGFIYNWADYGDIESVEYRDLQFMIRSRSRAIFDPRMIIMDSDVLALYPELTALYESLYTESDLSDVLKLPAKQMEKEIEALPEAARETLKGLVSTMISNHRLDSVQKIKKLDEIFGTQLLLTLAQE